MRLTWNVDQTFLLIRFTGTTNWYSSRTFSSEIQRSCDFWRSAPRLYNGRCLGVGEHPMGPASEHDPHHKLLLFPSWTSCVVSSSCCRTYKMMSLSLSGRVSKIIAQQKYISGGLCGIPSFDSFICWHATHSEDVGGEGGGFEAGALCFCARSMGATL